MILRKYAVLCPILLLLNGFWLSPAARRSSKLRRRISKENDHSGGTSHRSGTPASKCGCRRIRAALGSALSGCSQSPIYASISTRTGHPGWH